MEIKKLKMKGNRGGYTDRRKIFAVIAFIIAAIISFVILPSMYKSKDATEKVYIAAHTIEKGEEIQEDDIELKEVGSYNIGSVFTEESKDKIIGDRAAFDIVKGDILTKEKLGGTADITAAKLTQDGKKLITVSIKTNAAGLATHLRSGDVVNVWQIVEDDYGVETPYQDPLLVKMKVYSAENSSGYNVENEFDSAASGSDDIVSTVTLIIDNDAQAAALVKAEYSEGIHLELVGRE